MTDTTIMLDDFLMVNKGKVGAIKICDNNPHVLVYVEGVANPFRLKHPDSEANYEEQNKWAVAMFEDLQSKLATGFNTLGECEDFDSDEDLLDCKEIHELSEKEYREVRKNSLKMTLKLMLSDDEELREEIIHDLAVGFI